MFRTSTCFASTCMLVCALFFLSAPTANASILYSQGFESNTNGWFDQDNGWTGDIERVASGTGGIASSSGGFHATAIQTSAAGLFAPFSDFAGLGLAAGTNWPGGLSVTTDIYLDTNWQLGEGFDYSTAINNSAGIHQQDFIFHVTKDTSTGGLLVGGSNNTNFDPREDLETMNHFEVLTSGWYQFEHVFRDDGGILVGDLNLRNSNGDLLFQETRSGGAPIASTGGARYSWFTNIDIDGGIALDNHSMSAVPEPSAIAIWSLLAMAIGLVVVKRTRSTSTLKQNVG